MYVGPSIKISCDPDNNNSVENVPTEQELKTRKLFEGILSKIKDASECELKSYFEKASRITWFPEQTKDETELFFKTLFFDKKHKRLKQDFAETLCRRFFEISNKFDSGEIIDAACAFDNLEYRSNRELFLSLYAKIPSNPDINQIARIAFAFRKMIPKEDPQHDMVFANFRGQLLKHDWMKLTPENTGFAAYAFASVGFIDKDLMEKIVTKTYHKISFLSHHALLQILWSFAYNVDQFKFKVEAFDSIAPALVQAMISKAHLLNPDQTVRAIWSFEELRCDDQKLFSALYENVEKYADVFTRKNIATLIKEMLEVDCDQRKGLDKLLLRLRNEIQDFEPKELVLILSGLIIEYCASGAHEDDINLVLQRIGQYYTHTKPENFYELKDHEKTELGIVSRIYELKSQKSCPLPWYLKKYIYSHIFKLKFNPPRSSKLHERVMDALIAIRDKYRKENKFHIFHRDYRKHFFMREFPYKPEFWVFR
ncbi:MAG: hypothetical protein Tsb0021_08750 [Chlamydiales bacterium]